MIIFPARAGMIPNIRTMSAAALDIPRASGDDPFVKSQTVSGLIYSPRERG